MKNVKNTLVAVSVLALRAVLPTSPAVAQVQISCPQDMGFGRLATCGNGSYTITPNGATNTNGNCAMIQLAGMPAQCIINNGGIPVIKNVKVQFTANNINITNAGNKARVDNWRMLYSGTTTPQAKLTLTPAEVNNTVTIDIGATLDFNGNQPVGSYAGIITVTAN